MFVEPKTNLTSIINIKKVKGRGSLSEELRVEREKD